MQAKQSQARRHADCDHQTAKGSTRKIPGSSQNLSDIAKPVKNLPFPVLRLFLAGPERRVKSCDICKFTRAVANFRDCAPNWSIPPFVSDGGKERQSFTFFCREIRGVCIEKSGGVCIRANPHTLTYSTISTLAFFLLHLRINSILSPFSFSWIFVNT